VSELAAFGLEDVLDDDLGAVPLAEAAGAMSNAAASEPANTGMLRRKTRPNRFSLALFLRMTPPSSRCCRAS
jgi:hypothetical protein